MNTVKEKEERAKRRDEYVRKHTMEWLENGQKLAEKRLKHHMTLKEVAELLGTSATRVRRLEVGDPVTMAEHLTTCYNLLFDYIELRNGLYESSQSLLREHTFYRRNTND